MVRSDKSRNGDGRDPLVLFDLPQDQIDSDWEQFSKRHIDPTRIFQLSFQMIEETKEDRHHLEWCDCCRSVYDGYRRAEGLVGSDDVGRSARIHQHKLDRGRVVRDILLLLEVWGKPVSISVLEPALVLMRNDGARKTFLKRPTTQREKADLKDEPKFITGLNFVYQGMVMNGAIHPVGEHGYELANPKLLSHVSEADRSNAMDVVRAIEALSDLRRLPQVLAEITNERYEVTV